MFSKYGKVGIVSYAGISLANYCLMYALVSNHVDFVTIGKKLVIFFLINKIKY